MPEWIAVYLNKQKVSAHKEATVVSEEFALTHKNVFARHRDTSSAENSFQKKSDPHTS